MRQKVICTQHHACIRTIYWEKFMSWNKIISLTHYSYNFQRKVIFLSITFFAQFIAEKSLYTLLNSIWRAKPQHRMPGRGDLRWWSVWGRLHRYPLPSPPLWPLSLSHSSLGSSLQVRAQESVIEDGRRGEPSAVVFTRYHRLLQTDSETRFLWLS